ncbi:mCG119977, isoform CRA_c [Mus musculus]|nr:mCG119977, isoform CRA_c [Mus musculus]EDL16038.1 mCG119977, isoform CRA_c [Mus musculus]
MRTSALGHRIREPTFFGVSSKSNPGTVGIFSSKEVTLARTALMTI